MSAQHDTAREFAQLMRGIPAVREVWLRETQPDFEMAVVMRELDLARELEIRGIFIDLVCEKLGPAFGELCVVAEAEGVSDWFRDGERL